MRNIAGVFMKNKCLCLTPLTPPRGENQTKARLPYQFVETLTGKENLKTEKVYFSIESLQANFI